MRNMDIREGNKIKFGKYSPDVSSEVSSMWEKTPWWTYSLNYESGFGLSQYASKEDALKAAMEDAEIEGAERVFIGRINEYIPTVDAESVTNQIQSDGADAAAEEDVNWPFECLADVDGDDLYELEEMLTEAYKKWEDKHPEYKPKAYMITDIEEFQVSKTDK